MSKKIIVLGLLIALNSKSNLLFAQNLAEEAATWLTGSFSSKEQSLADTSYFNIHLQITPIWKTTEDGYWLYVEQAVASMLDKPYRQRVYHITNGTNGYVTSEIFTLDEPLRFSQKPELVEKLVKDSLKLKAGCAVVLNWDKKSSIFNGGTIGKGCPSDRKGASYATSKVSLYKDKMISWDQGFDAADKQVWGAEKGGYIFLRE